MKGRRVSIPGVDALFSPSGHERNDNEEIHERPKTGEHEGPQARIPAEVQAGIPEHPQSRMPEDTHPRTTASAPVSDTRATDSPREKFTFRFDASTLALLEHVWSEIRGRTGRKIRKSWIVEAALKHVIRDPEMALHVLLEEMKSVASA